MAAADHDPTLDDLLRAFEACALSREQWTHGAHLRVGLGYVRRYGPAEAIERLRAGIQRLNAALGTPPGAYHETITRGWASVIAALCEARADAGERALVDTLERGCSARYLLRFWQRDVLMSDEARRAWVAPDLGPIEPPAPGTYHLRWAYESPLLGEARTLFEEYAASLDVDLCFQGFAAELDGLPGPYAPPGGRLIVALDESGAAAGCVALRPLRAPAAELKRLYVRPAHRRTGLARRLVEAALREARDAAHRELLLDTLPTMTGAIALYRTLGFTDIAPYRENPVPGAVFLRRALGVAAIEP